MTKQEFQSEGGYIFHFPEYNISVALKEAAYNGDYLHFAVSQCSIVDTFSKKIAKRNLLAAWDRGEVMAIRKSKVQSMRKHAESIAIFFANGTD